MKLSRVTVALNQLRHTETTTITDYLNLFDDLAKDIQEETGKPLYEQDTGEGLELARGYIRLITMANQLFKKNGALMSDTRLFSRLEKSEETVSQISSEMEAMKTRFAELERREVGLNSLESQIGSLEQKIQEKEKLIARKEKDIQEAEKLKGECQTYLNAVSELENQTIPSWKTQIHELQTRYQTDEEKLKTIQQEYQNKENELNVIKRQGQELLASLQKQIAEKTGYQNQLMEEETQLKKKIAELDDLIAKGREELRIKRIEEEEIVTLATELKQKLEGVEKESPSLTYLNEKNQMIRNLYLAYGLDKPEVMAFEKSELPRLEALQKRMKAGLDEIDGKLAELSRLYQRLLMITENKEG